MTHSCCFAFLSTQFQRIMNIIGKVTPVHFSLIEIKFKLQVFFELNGNQIFFVNDIQIVKILYKSISIFSVARCDMSCECSCHNEHHQLNRCQFPKRSKICVLYCIFLILFTQKRLCLITKKCELVSWS